MLIKDRGEWKLNNEGHVVQFKAKHLAYISKVWHHFITSRLMLKTNVCEIEKRALLNYSIIQDIPFNVGQVIENDILYNKDAKMNLGYPFLIYGLCKKSGVPLEDNEAWIHLIKVIVVKKNKLGAASPDVVYDSGHEPPDEEELKAYQTLFSIHEEEPREVGQSSTQPPPPPPPSHEEASSSLSQTLEDQVHDLIVRFDAYWDETQEHHVSISQEIDTLKVDMTTV